MYLRSGFAESRDVLPAWRRVTRRQRCGRLPKTPRARQEPQPKMRFSVATFAWTWSFTNEHLDLVDKVAELGFDGFEIVFDGTSNLDAKRLRDRLEAAELGSVVTAFCLPDRDVSASDRTVREAGIRYLNEAVDFAATIGAPVVAGPIAHPPSRARYLAPEDRAAERRRAISSLRTVADRCGERGIRLGIEQLSRYDSDMFNTATQTLEFLAELDHESVGVHLDTFHMQIDEQSTKEAIRQVADKLVHVHAVESHRGELGTGQVAWDDVFEALLAIEYGGDVSIETFTWTGTEADALVNMWRPWFEEDSDDVAKRSLEFIRARLEAAREARV
jgi:D-psicose/D-tagatose/L-ribulose 3-epimerase